MNWEHSVRTSNTIAVLALRGHLDRASEDALHRTLVTEIRRDGVTVIYLDLREVTYLGAAAAAALLAASFAGRAAGRRVVLGECSDRARETLRRTQAAEAMRAPGAPVPEELAAGSAAPRRRRFPPRRKKALAGAGESRGLGAGRRSRVGVG
jgi:anti-anti-sigma factor